jgi:hypothetical protein
LKLPNLIKSGIWKNESRLADIDSRLLKNENGKCDVLKWWDVVDGEGDVLADGDLLGTGSSIKLPFSSIIGVLQPRYSFLNEFRLKLGDIFGDDFFFINSLSSNKFVWFIDVSEFLKN